MQDRRRVCGAKDYSQIVYDLRDKGTYSVFVGSKCPQRPDQCGKRRTVAQLKYHPEWNDCLRMNDLAIVELEEDIPESEAVPICMPESTTELKQVLAVAGAGMDPNLPRAQMYSKGLQVIELSLLDVLASAKLIRMHSPTSSSCSGDSGGPLFFRNDQGLYTLAGTVVAGNGRCGEQKNIINYFTDIRQYLRWICSETGVCSVGLQTAQWTPQRNSIYHQMNNIYSQQYGMYHQPNFVYNQPNAIYF